MRLQESPPASDGFADGLAKAFRVELILEPVKAVIRLQVLLRRIDGAKHSAEDLRRNHRLTRPAAEELVTALAIKDNVQPRVPRGAAEQVLRPRHGIAKRE